MVHWWHRALAWAYVRLIAHVYMPTSSDDASAHKYAWWEGLILGLPDRMCADCEDYLL